jgi:hypothetical protein
MRTLLASFEGISVQAHHFPVVDAPRHSPNDLFDIPSVGEFLSQM